MGIESDNAALRIMLRTMTPNITGLFESAAQQSGESKYNFYLMMGYDHRGDYENPANNRMVLKSWFSKLAVAVNTDQEKMDKDNKNLLHEIFPVAASFIQETAESWNIDPFGVLLHIRIVPGQEGKKDTLELKMKEKGAVGDANRREVLVV